MKTPSSTGRATRSQTMAASANKNLVLSRKVEESEKTMAESRKKSGQKQQQQQQDRSALIDITNDSPIVGLAMGNLKTPSSSSAMSKKRGQKLVRTPGSGEALLRRQVKTLLQKVEEEVELSKITVENRHVFNLVAPTPANTPHILSNFTHACLPPSLTPSPEDDKFFGVPQMMISEMLGEKEHESEDVVITRSLLLDFSDKSGDSSKCSSVLAYQGAFCCGDGEEVLTYDGDASSGWSMQVNASSTRDNEEECDDHYYHYEDVEEEVENDIGDKRNDGGLMLDELCEGISNISVKDCPKFMGKHIRFICSSDDEIEGEEQVFECEVLSSNALPTPLGTPVRLPLETVDN